MKKLILIIIGIMAVACGNAYADDTTAYTLHMTGVT